jgi:hypothetical protein
MKFVKLIRNFGSYGLTGEEMAPTISDFAIFKDTWAAIDGGGNP